MNLYDYRKQIQKIYDDSVYGNVKGDIYNELSELRIDNSFIEEVTTNKMNKRVTFKLSIDHKDNNVSELIQQIQSVIKAFVEKNVSCMSDGLRNFLDSNPNLYCDTYSITENNSKLVIFLL